MKKFLLLIFTVSIFSTISAQFPKKNFLIEDHTGAWCGWCVLGNQALEDLHAEYADRVIPIGVHNQDGMALPIQQQLAKEHAITGYPSGVINRKSYTINGKSGYGIHPSSWTSIIDSNSMKQTAPVDISITEWKIDTIAKEIKITIKAEFFEDINRPLAFNCAIIEDGVTGTGKLYDQSNYVSNASGYEAHPYYYQPSSITSYSHINVLRGYGAGIAGIAGTLPETGVFFQDKYTYTFTIPLSTIKISNVSNCWVAGWVQETSSGYEILNAASAGKPATPKSQYVSVDIKCMNPPTQILPGTVHKQIIKLTNKREFPVSVAVSIKEDESVITEDWKYTINPTIVEIPAKSSANAELQTIAGSGIGAANYVVSALVIPKDNIRGLPTSTRTSVISKEQKIVLVKFDATDKNAVLSTYNDIKSNEVFKDRIAIVSLNDSNYSSFDFSGAEAFIVGESYNSRTSLIYGTKKLLPFFESIFKAGTPILMWSPMNLWLVADNYPPVLSNSIKNVWNTTFGITGEEYPWQPLLWDVTNRKEIPFGLQGTGDSKITNGISFMVNEESNEHKSIWIDCIKVLDSSIAQPILHFNSDVLQEPLNIAAVKIQSSTGTRAIYQGFPTECAGSGASGLAIRQTLLSNYLYYLLNLSSLSDNALNPLNTKVYPNPANHTLTISSENNTNDSKWNIYSMDGILIGSGIQKANSSSHYDCSPLSNGSYYMIMDQKGIKSYIPFIVNH